MIGLTYLPRLYEAKTPLEFVGYFVSMEDAEEYAYQFLKDAAIIFFHRTHNTVEVLRKTFEKEYEERNSCAGLAVPRNIRILHSETP